MNVENSVYRIEPNVRRWAFLVGVNHYADSSISPLNYCVADAQALRDLLLNHPEHGYTSERTQLLTNQSSTLPKRRSVLRSLVQMASETDQNDLLLFYFSGHGVVLGGTAYLVVQDSETGALLEDTTIPLKRIKTIMKSAAARAKVIILDACHLGVPLQGRALSLISRDFIKSVFEDAEGFAVLAASAMDQRAWEDSRKGHGVFTYYLLEGLRGAADTQPDRRITLYEIANYVKEYVEAWARKNFLEEAQRPTLDFQGSGEPVLLMTPDTVIDSGISSEVIEYSPLAATFPEAVRNPVDFFNREEEVDTIKDILTVTANLPLVIRGERGIGKTTLLNHIQCLLGKASWSGQIFIHFAIEPGSFRTLEAFELEFWEGLKGALEISGFETTALEMQPPPSPVFTRNGFSARLRRIWKALPTGVIFGVFLDEIDKTVPKQKHTLQEETTGEIQQLSVYQEIIGLIHHLVEQTEIPIVFFISALQALLPSSFGSPLPHQEIRLPPFTPTALEEMIRVLLVANDFSAFQPWIFEWFYQYSGGHPYIAKLLITLLLEHFRAERTERTAPMRPEDLDVVIKIACIHGQSHKLFKDIYWRFLNKEERQVIVLLAQHKEPQLIPNGLLKAATQLSRRNYLFEDEDGYRFRIGLMKAWLRAWEDFQFEVERFQKLKLHALPSAPPPRVFAEIVPEGICIDLDTQRVYVEGQVLSKKLSRLQFKALTYFAEQSGKVISKAEIAAHLYPGEHDELAYEATDRVYALINRLKHTLGEKPNGHKYLENVRGSGYRLEGATVARTLS